MSLIKPTVIMNNKDDSDKRQDKDILLFLQMQSTSLSQLQEVILSYNIWKLQLKLECLGCIAVLYSSPVDPPSFPHLRLV